MKIYYRIAVVTIILVLAFASLAAAPAAQNHFSWAGVWKGTDVLDGSNIQVRITAQGSIMFVDKVYAACAGSEVKGTGGSRQVGNTLFTGLKLKCTYNGAVIANNYSLAFTPAGPNTLVDTNGNVYTLVKRDCRNQ